MSLSFALGSSCSAHAGRSSGKSLVGVSFLGSSSLLLRPPLQHDLLQRSYRRRRDAGCGLSNSGGVRKGKGEEAKASIRRASCCNAAAGAAFGTTSGVPLRLGRYSQSQGIIHNNGKARGHRIVCSAAALDFETLQWISSISCLVLMLAKGTAVQKSFLAPLFALQAPTSIISWIKGEYGIWTAFLALLVRLFYFIPGELDLPFLTMLLVIVGPQQAMSLRETKTGAIISLVIAGYMLFQHFSRSGSLQKAFDQGSVVATLAVICIISVPCLLLF